MPTFQFEAMDKTGQEIREVVEAETQEEPSRTIKQRGLFLTKIAQKKARKGQTEKVSGRRKARPSRWAE